jgi:23S rRNA (uracil1939-C5)-methyltransferase
MLMPLRELIGAMDLREAMPQIELAAGEGVTALVLRNLEPLTPADLQRLRDFAALHGVQWWLQPKGPDTVHLLDEGGPVLSYRLPEFGVTMPFRPTDFTQVNHAHQPRAGGSRAAPAASRRHTSASSTGSAAWAISRCRWPRGGSGAGHRRQRHAGERGRESQRRVQRLAAKTSFAARNLFELMRRRTGSTWPADKWLVDPPREGAFALAKALADLQQAAAAGYSHCPVRIVYVSCNPATLARDAGLLVHQAGYRCCQLAGAVNMFPHTAHVESMAVFDREG